MSSAIQASSLHFSRGGFSLSLPQWCVDAGQRVALHGPSGCGKSTLLGLISGQLTPTSGRLMVDGQDLTALSLPARRAWRARRIGFIFQDFPLIDHLSALENVLLPYRISQDLHLTGAIRAQAAALLDALSLHEHHRAMPSRLSQGERQRVAIARALVTEPGLLLADEPTAGLDPSQSAAVLELLWGLSVERGLTLILVTHDPSLLARFSLRLNVSACSVMP